MEKQKKRRNWIPEADIIESVGCPYCGAEMRKRCHRYGVRAYGLERGRACKPHRQRVALYRRRLCAQRITERLDEMSPSDRRRLRIP
jgi:hypothetical protein